jgi:dipeptidyl aminopeptidase/acylaminoacyl peptidase
MRIFQSVFCFLLSITGFSQIPSTDIYFANVVQKGNEFYIINIKNITSRIGYDNQPCFSEDGNFIYFSSDRDGSQTDIYRYEIKKGKTERITKTNESEYSPALIPGSDALSVVRINTDSAQYLYRILPDGSNPVNLYTGRDSIAYHSWIDSNRILISESGETNSVSLLDLVEQETIRIAENTGGSMYKIRAENAVSFTVKSNYDNLQIKKFNGLLNKVENITKLPAGSEYHAWLNESTIVSGSKGKLYFFDLNNKKNGWQLMADLSNTPAANFNSITFDPSGKKIALVVLHQAAE